MDTVISFTPAQLWTGIVAFAAGITAICVAAGHIVKAAKAARAPAKALSDRVAALEGTEKHHGECLARDKNRLDSIEACNRIALRALMALLKHGIDGNDVKAMASARDEINAYLLSK